MKKKILSILLGAIMCLTALFAFASCSDEEGLETKPIFNYIDTEVEDEFNVPAYTEKVTFQVEGTPEESSDNVLLTIQETVDLAAATPVDYVTYRFYSLKTGTKLAEFVVDNLSVAEGRLTDVHFEYVEGSDYSVIVTEQYGNRNVNVTVLDKDGAKVVEDEFYLPYYSYSLTNTLPSAISLLREYENHVMFNKVLYRAGANGYEAVEDFNVSPINSSSSNLLNLKYINNKFILVENNVITIFDNNFSYISSYKVDYSSNSSCDLFTLDSGNVLVLIRKSLENDAKEYDYTAISPLGDPVKFGYEYYIYDTTSCVLNPVEAKSNVIVNAITEIEGLKLPEGCSLATVSEVVDEKIMRNTKYAVIDANGSVLNLIDVPEGLESIETLVGNRALFTFSYGQKVIYSLNGTKLYVVEDDTLENIGSYYISADETKIYDSAMNVSYDIPTDYEIIDIFNNDTVFFKKDVELAADEYYIWKSGTVTKVDADNVVILDGGYATIKSDAATSSTTYVFYNAQGTAVKTISSTLDAPVLVDANEIGDSIIVLTLDKDSKTSITVFAQ